MAEEFPVAAIAVHARDRAAACIGTIQSPSKCCARSFQGDHDEGRLAEIRPIVAADAGTLGVVVCHVVLVLREEEAVDRPESGLPPWSRRSEGIHATRPWSDRRRSEGSCSAAGRFFAGKFPAEQKFRFSAAGIRSGAEN